MKHAKQLVIALVLGIVLAGGISWAYAQTNGNTVYGCVSPSGGLSIVGAADQCKNNESPLQWNIVGPVGPIGPQGPQGIQGETGATGEIGAVGPQGERGPRGLQGSQGAQGYTGETGAAGADGPQGSQGETGATGPAGPAGPRGYTGTQGPQGETGPAGPAGPTGLGDGLPISKIKFVSVKCDDVSSGLNTCKASCPANHYVINAGYSIAGSYDATDIQNNVPWDFHHDNTETIGGQKMAKSWKLTYLEGHSSQNISELRVDIWCIKIDPDS